MITLVNQNNSYRMKDNIYIKALEIGFENETNGISFNEVVKELGIEENLKNIPFKVNFLLWFYTNFYCCSVVEKLAMNSATGGNFLDAVYRISEESITNLDTYSSTKSFIKGAATQKYNDYLELKETREASQIARKSSKSAEKYSQSARRFAFASIFIAIAAIIIPLITPESPKQVIVTENRDKIDNAVILARLTKIDSTINSTITKLSLIADKKVEVSANKTAKTKPLNN